MGFDAGKITAHLDLTTDDFNEKADEAEKKKEQLGQDVTTKVTVAGVEEAKKELDGVIEKKDEAEGPIDIPVKAELKEFEADAAEIKAVKEEIAKPVEVPVKIDRNLAQESAISARKAMTDAFGENVGQYSFIDKMLSQGTSDADVATSVKAMFNHPIAVARQMVTDFANFQVGEVRRVALESALAIASVNWHALTGGALTSPVDVLRALPAVPSVAESVYGQSAIGTGSGGGGLAFQPAANLASLYSDWAQGQTNWDQGWASPSQWNALSPYSGHNPGALVDPNNGANWDYGNGVGRGMGMEVFQGVTGGGGSAGGGSGYAHIYDSFGYGGASGNAGKTEAQKFADAWKTGVKKSVEDAQYSIFQGLSDSRGSVGSAWKDIFSGKSGIADEISKAAKKMGVDVGKDFTDTMSKGIMDAAKTATSFGGGGGFLGSITGGISSAAQSAVGAAGGLSSSISGMSPMVTGGIVAAPLIVPILGAVGLAAGGVAAGTGIGTAGLLAGLLPGLLDLKTGYGAYQATQAFNAAGGDSGPNAAQNVATYQQATAGDTTGNLQVGSAIGDLIHGGNGFLGGLEQQVNPDILKFIDSLTKMLPIVAPFFQTATDAMKKFFDRVDAAMTSDGFKTFMKTMTKDVGPIMDDFATFTGHAVGAIGGFLQLFGGAPAQAVGKWFDDVSGKLDTFLNNATISPGFLQGMTDAFNFLGAVGSALWTFFSVVGQALAPIGLTMMKVLTPAFQGLVDTMQKIDPNVITALGVALGVLVIAGSPLLQVVVAFALIAAGIEKLNGYNNNLSAGNYKPMSGQDLGQAFAGELTPADKRTKAENAAIDHANALGLSPADIYNAYSAIAPKPVGGGGTGSTSDGVTIGPGGNITPARPTPAQTGATNKAQNPDYGVFSAENMAKTYHGILTGIDAIPRLLSNNSIAHVLDNITGGISNWVTKSLPHAFDQVRHTVAHAFDDVTGGVSDWVTKSLPHAFESVYNGIKNWITNSLPHAFDQVRHTAAHAFDDVTGGVSDWVTKSLPHAFEGVYNGISNWVTNSLPHAFDNIRHSVASAFDGAETWLESVGTKIINGLIKGINAAIDKANGLTKGLPFGMGDVLHIPNIGYIQGPSTQTGSFGVLAPGKGAQYADGGWVTAPTGAPQLAIVHGGEFVMSRAMIAGGAMGGTTVQINVDARGATNPAAVASAAESAVHATVPALRRAITGSRAA